MPKSQRSKSIVQQPNLLDGDFLPLYHPDLPNGKRGLRKNPEDFLIALRDKFTGYNHETKKDIGMYLECELMDKLITILNTKILAKAILVNTEIKAPNDSKPTGMALNAFDSAADFFGVPGAKLGSWALKKAYDIKISRINKRINSIANYDIDVRTHICIFAYLFSLIVSPELQKYLPDNAREALTDWYKNWTANDRRNVPLAVKSAFNDIVTDIVHVLEKDLTERRTPIHYEDMLITAIMGIPACRLNGNNESKVSPLLQDHISSKYSADRSDFRQTVIVAINPILDKLGFRPYNEGMSTAGLITRIARQKLRSIKANSEHLSLWKELDSLKRMHRHEIIGFESRNMSAYASKLLADGIVPLSNREAFKKANPTAAGLLKAKSEAKEFELQTVANENFTPLLQRIIKQFNTTTARQQILDQSTDLATASLETLCIGQMSRIDTDVLDGIALMFHEDQVKLPGVQHLTFEGQFDFGSIDPVATEKFVNEIHAKYPNIVVHFPEAKTTIDAEQQVSAFDEASQTSTTLDVSRQDSLERSDVASSGSGLDNTPTTPVSPTLSEAPLTSRAPAIKSSKTLTFSEENIRPKARQESAKPSWTTPTLQKAPARPVAPSIASEVSSAMSPYHNVLRSTSTPKPETAPKATENRILKHVGSYFRKHTDIEAAASARDSARAQLVTSDAEALKETSPRYRAETVEPQLDAAEIELATVPVPAPKGPFKLKPKKL